MSETANVFSKENQTVKEAIQSKVEYLHQEIENLTKKSTYLDKEILEMKLSEFKHFCFSF